MEKEIVKVRTLKGRIITLTIQGRTPTHIYGVDKYNTSVILKILDIDEMISMPGDYHE